MRVIQNSIFFYYTIFLFRLTSQRNNLWNTMDLAVWLLLLVTLMCFAATFMLFTNAYLRVKVVLYSESTLKQNFANTLNNYIFEQSLGGQHYDNFELVTMAIRVLMAESSEAFSNTTKYPLSGVLLRGVAAATLPVLLYGFNGNLKARRLLASHRSLEPLRINKSH